MTAKLSERQMLLRDLIAEGTIRMCWAPEVLEQPAPFAGRRVSADRVRGMLLGLAIGDSLGNTSEGCLPDIRQARLGEVRDYLPNRHANSHPVGLPSDDTQLAFWILQHLLECGCVEPDALAELFCSHGSSASAGRPGSLCLPGARQGTGKRRRNPRPATEH